MKVFNLTDIPTDKLERLGLVKRTFVVACQVIEPGDSVEVDDNASVRASIKSQLDAGAVAVDELPEEYLLMKERAEADTLPAPGEEEVVVSPVNEVEEAVPDTERPTVEFNLADVAKSVEETDHEPEESVEESSSEEAPKRRSRRRRSKRS